MPHYLNHLLENVDHKIICGSPDKQITALIYNTSKLEQDCLFVCIRGYKFDPLAKIEQILAASPAAIVVDENYNKSLFDAQAIGGLGVCVICVPDTRKALALVSSAYFGHPERELFTIGITGTKGKTTTAYLIRQLLENAGTKTGLIGTIETIINSEHIKADNTTPESYIVYETFRKMSDAGIEAVVMEVSSQGLKLSRVAGIIFDIAIFTNLSPDHISPLEHADFEEYARCKSLLFKQCKIGIGNADDRNFEKVFENADCKVLSFACDCLSSLRGEVCPKTRVSDSPGECDVAAFPKVCLSEVLAKDLKPIKIGATLGMSFTVDGQSYEIALPGNFSVYNALCALLVARIRKIDEKIVNKTFRSFKVKGRVEPVKVSDDFTVLIDYAHNAMSLSSLLTTLRLYSPTRLVCLFGCGADRAKDRRFEMGRVAGKLADFTIVTSDNPRTEDPNQIIADILSTLVPSGGRFIEIADRSEAIRYSLEHARQGDIIALCGKGHEDYQEINGIKYMMDERDIIAEILSDQCRNMPKS